MRAPREHGALFSAPMVRAVLAEVEPKTQTRRILTRANSVLDYDGGPLGRWPGLDFRGLLNPTYPRAFSAAALPSCVGAPDGVVSLCAFASGLPNYTPRDRTVHRIYPRVRVGDRLWVRETWAPHPDGTIGAVVYRATDPRWDDSRSPPIGPPSPRSPPPWGLKWHPSILMPRWASRITLEVTDVRVERVQDIGDADIRAEGVTAEAVRELVGEAPKVPADTLVALARGDLSPRELWRLGWIAINGVESWDANVWLWAYSFRRVSC